MSAARLHVGVLSSQLSLDNVVNDQQSYVDEDAVLCRAGFPQGLLYVLRAANLTWAEIGRLPVPYSTAQAGEGAGNGIASSYWRQLRDAGVPFQCLPQGLRDELTPQRHALPSRQQADFDGFVDLRQQARIPQNPANQQLSINYQQRFGSPIRPLGTPSQPATVRRQLGYSNIPSTPQGALPQSVPPATPLGGQAPPSGIIGVEYLQNVPYVMSPGEWTRTRDGLLRNGDCTIFGAFSMEDKHFQQLAVTVKPPASMKEIGGTGSSSHDAWRDVKDYYETLDVWNFFCSVLSGNFRAYIDNNHSISLGVDLLARKLESLPTTRFVGHTPFSIGISRWHAEWVLDKKSLVFAPMSSVALRERIIRPGILAGISADAKLFVRASFPHDDGTWICFTLCIHSWRYTEADTWRALFDLDRKLSSKKLIGAMKSLRDWRCDMERWRDDRRALTGGLELDAGHLQLWVMRIVESCSREVWCPAFRKEMTKDERKGEYIESEDDLWTKLEFEESFISTRGASVNLIEDSPFEHPFLEPDSSNALVMYTGE